jgi:hypothetical protein
MASNQRLQRTRYDGLGPPSRTAEPQRSGGHAPRVRQNAALTSFAAWFGIALRAAEPGCFTCRGGRQAFGSPSPAQVSAALACSHSWNEVSLGAAQWRESKTC